MAWNIGGITPSLVTKAGYDLNKKQLILQCIASKENLNGSDPRTEINQFLEIACDGITNEELANGGTDLQTESGGGIIPITDGFHWWDGALNIPTFKEDKWANRQIEYQLVLDILITSGGGSFTYLPLFTKYWNMVYYQYTDHDVTDLTNLMAGIELGEITLYETRKVRKINIWGSANKLPSYVEVNGERQYWEKSSSGIEGELQGNQLLEFDLETPIEEILIKTSEHTQANKTGCRVQYIQAEYL
jgi:hypothetical protein